jgi:hypothetical protein
MTTPKLGEQAQGRLHESKAHGATFWTPLPTPILKVIFHKWIAAQILQVIAPGDSKNFVWMEKKASGPLKDVGMGIFYPKGHSEFKVLVTKKTDLPVLWKLHKGINEWLTQEAFDLIASDPEGFEALLQSTISGFTKYIRLAKIQNCDVDGVKTGTSVGSFIEGLYPIDSASNRLRCYAPNDTNTDSELTLIIEPRGVKKKSTTESASSEDVDSWDAIVEAANASKFDSPDYQPFPESTLSLNLFYGSNN